MTNLQEEKEFHQIKDAFAKAIDDFNKKDFKSANEKFGRIVEEYKDSDYYNVLEIQARSKVYLNITDSHLNPVEIVLESDEDFLSEGLYNLNAGDLERARELFEYLVKQDKKDPYIYYLLATTLFKRGEKESALEYLAKCVELDAHYKIIIHNEPDFEALLEDEQFSTLVG